MVIIIPSVFLLLLYCCGQEQSEAGQGRGLRGDIVHNLYPHAFIVDVHTEKRGQLIMSQWLSVYKRIVSNVHLITGL